jgi:hypothetical protein
MQISVCGGGAMTRFGLRRHYPETAPTEPTIASNKCIFFPPNKGRHGVKAGFINRYSIEVLTGRFSRATHPNTDHTRCC